MIESQLGPVLAGGNTSDVHAWTDGHVVKLLRSNIPPAWADVEAGKMAAVFDLGLPAPRITDRIEIDGRPGIVMERIDGPSMWSVMCWEPDRLPALTQTLVELQREIASVEAPVEFPSLTDRLTTGIAGNDLISERLRRDLLAQLGDMEEQQRLLHFDIHPENVLLSERGPFVIDWFDALSGAPAADVARSRVLMDPVASPSHLAGASMHSLVSVHHEYHRLTADHDMSDTSATWRQLILAGRMSEPLPSQELEALHEALAATTTDGLLSG